MKKIISICTGLIIIMSGTVAAFASFDDVIIESSSSFNKEWERVALDDGKKAKMVYGFDKTLINEDYIYGTHPKKQHYNAILQEGKKKTSNIVSAGKKAKLEMRHRGNTVVYMMFY